MTNHADPTHLASKKPVDLDLHYLQMQGIPGFSRTRVNSASAVGKQWMSLLFPGFCHKVNIMTGYNLALLEKMSKQTSPSG